MPTPITHAPEASPECPRCGYDLRGETDRWTDACPLESICPECGLRVNWSFMFGPDHHGPAWSVEHPDRRFIPAAVSTFLRTLLPGGLWRTLVMSSHARPVSLACYAIVGAITVSLLAAIPEIVIDLNFGYLRYAFSRPQGVWRGPSNTDLAYHALSMLLAPFGTFWWSRYSWPSPIVDWQLMLPPLFVVLCPAAYLCLPATLNLCKVRKRHIARAFLLGVPATVLWYELIYLGHVLLQIAFSNATGRFAAMLYAIERYAESGLLWIVAALALQWVWWQSVNRRYLCLPNPKAVTFAMLLIAGLGTLIPLFAFTRAGVVLVELLGLA